jgi:nitrogen fixation protein FixH
MVIRLLLLLGLSFAPAVASAQGHGHSHHGGQEVKIGKFEAELVVKGSEVTLYVNDANDQKIDASGFTATAVVLAKGNQQKTISLAPAGENKLAGKIDFPVEGKFRATVTLKNSSGELGKGRYNVDVAR